MAKSNVIPFALRKDDVFEPPILPPLLEVRKYMGLTEEEASSVLHISKETLAREETLDSPTILNDIYSVLIRYDYYLSIYATARERNLINNRICIRTVRLTYHQISLKDMGGVYGGYSARAWYHFEMHDALLPRYILEQIEYDLESR